MATTRRDAGPARREGLRPRTVVLAALGVLAVGLLAAWAWTRFQPEGAPAARSTGEPATARRLEVALSDAQTVWSRGFPGYTDAGVLLFSGTTPTPCSGGGPVSGPFYCAETGTIAFDLGFLDRLGQRLERQRELGLALVAGRLASEHFQRETGLLDAASLRLVGARRARRAEVFAALALQADCLTGVWAAAAEPRLGPVPDGFYDRLVWSWRNVVVDLRREGVRVPPQFDPMAAAGREERTAAFARGYAAGSAEACPTPESVVPAL